jgi:signal transduction histidine kinase
VEVDVDFSNSRRTYGKDIDPIIYKMVQEGLINAYRHGHATRVGMTFRETGGELRVRIMDNGGSSKKISKGIGLQGMEERVSGVGGAVEFVAGEGGFSIAASIPLAPEARAASGG